MSELPKGWVEITIGDVAQVKGGKRLPQGSKLSSELTRYPYIRVKDFEKGSVNTLNLMYLDEATHLAIKNYTISKSDLYISIAGTIGLVGMIPQSLDGANLTENAAKLCELTGVNRNYLKYVLSSSLAKAQFEDKATSSGQPKLALFRIKDCIFPFAPLAEQKRIVEKLDQVLAQVGTIKARLDGIPAILKRFRQSVLAAAVSGKLTEEWRGNHKFSWKESCIGDVASVSTGKTPKRTEPSYWESPSVPWLTSSATGSLFCNKAEQYVSQFAVDDCKLKLFGKGTLLLAMYGEGKTRGQVTELTFEATCNQACAAITVKEAVALISFVKLRLLENYEETRKAAAGGNQPNLNLNKVREIPINLPLREEQTEIVRLVDQYFAFADTIEKQVQKAQQRVDKLTQSILAKAFRGELVSQDPTDEPADELLKRIAAARAESEALAKATKKVSKKK